MENLQNNTEFYIRRFTSEDTALVYDFFTAASEETRYFLDAHVYDLKTAEKFTSAEELAKKDVRRYAAVINRDGAEMMVGYLFFWDWTKRIPWLGIGVRDGYKGMGIGKRIMDFASQEARENGKGGILLTTKKDNLRAQALYKKCGYEFIGEQKTGDIFQHLMLLNFTDPQ